MLLPSVNAKKETKNLPRAKVEVVVIGCSAGGQEVLRLILSQLPVGLQVAFIIVCHISGYGQYYLPKLLNKESRLPVKEAIEGENILPGQVYLAPPGYHLLVEAERTFSLSVDEKVCYVRPSIDVLFCSVADVYGANIIGVILTGANNDGEEGIKAIKQAGGYCLVQNPEEAYSSTMPKAAKPYADRVLSIDQLILDLIKHCAANEAMSL